MNSVQFNKKDILDSTLSLMDPMMGQKAVKNIQGNTIFWTVDETDIAPWKSISELIKEENQYIITFPTNEFLNNTYKTKINAELILNDNLLSQNKIQLRISTFILSPTRETRSFNLFYNIDPKTYNVIPDNNFASTMKEHVGGDYIKFGLYPVFISFFIMWVSEFINNIFKSMKGKNKMFNNSPNYHDSYIKYKKKYLNMKNNM